MAKNSKHSRRSFVSFLLGTVVVPRSSQAINSCINQYDTNIEIACKLLELFTSAESAAIIGRIYLNLNPAESHITTLVNHLFPAENDKMLALQANADKLREHLSAARENEFTNGFVVSLDGWILAESEARLCAIAALDERCEMGRI